MNKMVNYFKGVKSELSRVRWSKKNEVAKDFAAVLITILLLVGFFVLSDFLIVNIKELLF
ncbi:preprotein translocase subunit SecE [Bacillus thuringiensis]|uniref:preprotein translocase subunit SecE n=1 Tax=Bacillus thuringiensis TaxID=1428 RepID=UPI0021D671A1|nr:preprotein translocase subunit SecE [Bacillus thuringiensis]MCU7667142.1 preprotein translocase subunit SecE [Bacillus thuringiensis]